MTDSTDNARGPERIWAESKTCTVDASGASRLLAMDREFSRGTEYIRADLAPDPLADARVQTMVEALTIIDALDPEGMINGCSQSALTGLVLRMGETARAALAALSPTGGNADVY